jgi:hypothetical protein
MRIENSRYANLLSFGDCIGKVVRDLEHFVHMLCDDVEASAHYAESGIKFSSQIR